MAKDSNVLKLWQIRKFSAFTWLTLTSILLLVGLVFVWRTFATAATLYLSPASATVNQGSNFAVAVRVNTGGDAVNAIQANLSYPAGLLDFVSISPAGSAFEIQAESSGGSGQIRIGRGTVSPVSGDALVATITFKGKSSGVATVSFNGDSAVVRSSDSSNILSTTQPGTYTVQVSPNPPAPPPSPPSAPPSSPGTPSPSSTSSTPSSTTSNSSGSSSGGATLNQTPSGGSVDATSGNQTLQRVSITMIDLIGQPIEGAEVMLAGQTKSTDPSGTAEFNSVPPGGQTVAVKVEGRSFEKPIDVKVSAELQAFQLKVATNMVRNLGFGMIAFSIISALAGGLILFRRRLNGLTWPRFRAKPNSPAIAAEVNDSSLFPATNSSITPGAVFQPQPPASPGQTPQNPPPPPT